MCADHMVRNGSFLEYLENSDVFKGYRKAILCCNGLKLIDLFVKITPPNIKIIFGTKFLEKLVQSMSCFRVRWVFSSRLRIH